MRKENDLLQISYFMNNRFIFFALIGVLIVGCNRVSKKDYLIWYSQIKPYTLQKKNIKISIIEYPFELAWISFYKDQLTPELLDSLSINAPKIVQFKMKIEDSSENHTLNTANKPNDLNPKVTLNNQRVLDFYKLGNIQSQNTSEYMVVVNKDKENANSAMEVRVPNTDIEFILPLSQILLNNPKILKL